MESETCALQAHSIDCLKIAVLLLRVLTKVKQRQTRVALRQNK